MKKDSVSAGAQGVDIDNFEQFTMCKNFILFAEDVLRRWTLSAGDSVHQLPCHANSHWWEAYCAYQNVNRDLTDTWF